MPSTIGIVASGEDVLNDAVFWVDAGRSSVVSGALSNLGTGGSALNAVFGNSTGVDSFDPALLAHTGTNYLYVPGVISNYAGTPDAAALDITGDIDISVRVELASLTNHALVSKWGGGASRSFVFYIGGDQNLYFETTPDGSFANRVTAGSTATLSSAGVGANATVWLRVTRDVDNGASGNSTTFYWSADSIDVPSLWTTIGSTVVKTGTTSLYAGNDSLTVGYSLSNNTNALTGKLYRAIVRNGIGGTVVFDADFTTGITSGGQTTFTESSANAATVTINRSTSGRKSVAVTRPILLFGTDDYLEVADNDLLDFGASDSFTVVAVVRQWATPTSFGRYIDKKNGGGVGVGWDLTSNGTAIQPALFIGDATNGANRTGSVVSAGTLQIFSGLINRSAQTAQVYTNNTASATASTTTVGSLANSLPMRIGIAANIASSNSDMELVAAAVWRRALNANEIATIVARYT